MVEESRGHNGFQGSCPSLNIVEMRALHSKSSFLLIEVTRLTRRHTVSSRLRSPVMTASICLRTVVLYHSPSLLSSPRREKGRDPYEKSAFLRGRAFEGSAGEGEGDEDGQRDGQNAMGDQGHAADGAEGGAVGVPIIGGAEEACEGGHGGGDVRAEEKPAEGETAPPHDDIKARQLRQVGVPREGGVVIDPEGGNEEAGDGDGQADIFFGLLGDREHRLLLSVRVSSPHTVAPFPRRRMPENRASVEGIAPAVFHGWRIRYRTRGRRRWRGCTRFQRRQSPRGRAVAPKYSGE